MRYFALVFGGLFLACAGPATAQSLFVWAANGVPVALIEVLRTPTYTEVVLQAQQTRSAVCWHTSGPDAPYLLAAGLRYRFISGGQIAACPSTRRFAIGDVMALRFEPLPAQVTQFSLVEGQGGENQMIDPKSSKTKYWNFLHVDVPAGK